MLNVAYAGSKMEFHVHNMGSQQMIFQMRKLSG